MKTEDLQAIGLGEDQIKKVFELNGKDVNAEKRNTAKAEEERNKWKERAEAAEETLKGFDGVDVAKLNQEIEGWKDKAEKAEKDYQQKIYERDFEEALKTGLEEYKFTSESAKWAVMERAKQGNLVLKDGKILGLKDLVDQIKAGDASAFAPDEAAAAFTQFPEGGAGGMAGRKSLKNMSLDERIKLKGSNPDYYSRLRKGE